MCTLRFNTPFFCGGGGGEGGTGSRDGAVVRTLASHQCGPSSIYLINSDDKTEHLFLLPHRHSTTICLETIPLWNTVYEPS